MVTRRRIHSFEFNDSEAAPAALREAIVETLSRGLEWGGVLNRLVAPYAAFLQAAKSHEVLDLCSGAGRPARILTRALARSGFKTPRFLLTDLRPHAEAWTALQREAPETIQFVPTSVDATAISSELSAQRSRLIINALHHFPPAMAQRIFADAVQQQAPIFIAECFERGLLKFFPMLPHLLLAHLVNPVLAPRHKLVKILLTWLTPIGALAGAWDGFISTLRVYSEEELRAMVAPLGGGYVWTYGRFPFAPGGRGYYFHGIPKAF